MLVHDAETGRAAFSASRDDLVLVVGVVVVGLVLAWLVAAVLVAVTPARHLLVPHAEHWKAPSRRRELRRRLQHHVALGVGVVLGGTALQLVVTTLAQGDGPFAAWWLPAAASVLTVLVLVVGGLVLVTTAWTPGRAEARATAGGAGRPRPAPADRGSSVVAGTAAPGGTTPRGGAGGVRSGGTSATGAGRASGTPAAGRPGAPATGRPAGGRGGRAGPTTGGAAGAGRTGPPRPDQPAPRRPAGRDRHDEGDARG